MARTYAIIRNSAAEHYTHRGLCSYSIPHFCAVCPTAITLALSCIWWFGEETSPTNVSVHASPKLVRDGSSCTLLGVHRNNLLSMSCNSDNDPRECTTWRSQGCKYVELGSLRLRTVRQAITLFPARSLQVHTMVAGRNAGHRHGEAKQMRWWGGGGRVFAMAASWTRWGESRLCIFCHGCGWGGRCWRISAMYPWIVKCLDGRQTTVHTSS